MSPINLKVQILFDEPIQAGALAGVTLTAAGESSLSVTKVLSNANQTLTVIPPALLKPSTVYTVQIAGIVDIAGNPLAAPVTFSFTTGTGAALVAPAVTTVIPAANATNLSRTTTGSITVAAPVNPLALTPASFRMYLGSNGVAVTGTTTISPDGRTVTFTPAATLTANTVYHLYFAGVRDQADNTIATIDIAFTTGN